MPVVGDCLVCTPPPASMRDPEFLSSAFLNGEPSRQRAGHWRGSECAAEGATGSRAQKNPAPVRPGGLRFTRLSWVASLKSGVKRNRRIK